MQQNGKAEEEGDRHPRSLSSVDSRPSGGFPKRSASGLCIGILSQQFWGTPCARGKSAPQK